jgi:hypothetical protein
MDLAGGEEHCEFYRSVTYFAEHDEVGAGGQSRKHIVAALIGRCLEARAGDGDDDSFQRRAIIASNH